MNIQNYDTLSPWALAGIIAAAVILIWVTAYFLFFGSKKLQEESVNSHNKTRLFTFALIVGGIIFGATALGGAPDNDAIVKDFHKVYKNVKLNAGAKDCLIRLVHTKTNEPCEFYQIAPGNHELIEKLSIVKVGDKILLISEDIYEYL